MVKLENKGPQTAGPPCRGVGEAGRRQETEGEGGREGGVAATPEHKNNEARGAMGPSWLVPESLSDLDRCHSWAPGEEPQPPAASVLQPGPPTPPGQGRLRLPQASHRQTPAFPGEGKGESPGSGGDWKGVQLQGLLRVAQPPGVAGCEHRELAIVLELSCVCARVCARVKVKPSMSVGVTGTKIVLVCLCPWGSHKQEGGADIPAVDGDGHRWLPYPLPETQLPWPVPARLG